MKPLLIKAILQERQEDQIRFRMEGTSLDHVHAGRALTVAPRTQSICALPPRWVCQVYGRMAPPGPSCLFQDM